MSHKVFLQIFEFGKREPILSKWEKLENLGIFNAGEIITMIENFDDKPFDSKLIARVEHVLSQGFIGIFVIIVDKLGLSWFDKFLCRFFGPKILLSSIEIADKFGTFCDLFKREIKNCEKQNPEISREFLIVYNLPK